MATGFLSEDGKSFVSVKDSTDGAVLEDDGDGSELNVDDVDLSSIPEEHRATFQRLAADLKQKSEMLDGLKKNSDLADAIKGLKTSVDGSRGTVPGDKKVAEKKKLLEDVKFEDKDYYKQFFDPLIEAINKLDDRIDALGGEVIKTKTSTWQDRVVRFISDEKLPKEVVEKMDELARTMGGGVYNDLPRLAKLAKLELGISTKKVDLEEKKTVVKKKGAVEMSSTRKTSSAKKPIKSMSDAWDAAETSLQGEEG